MSCNKNHNNKEEANNEKHPAGEVKDESVMVLKKEYEELKAKAAERDAYYDKYLRAHADFENSRKRIEKDKNDFIKYANEGFIIELLPILDSLEMAEKHIKEAKDFKAVQEGVDMIQSQIQAFLKDLGVERVKTDGEKFDPHRHEPIEVEESDDKGDGLILSELKAGYMFNNKLLRPASVKIGKKKTDNNEKK